MRKQIIEKKFRLIHSLRIKEGLMSSTRAAAGFGLLFLFLLAFISPLHAAFPDEEPLSSGEFVTGEEPPFEEPGGETISEDPSGEEPVFSEAVHDRESDISEGPIPDEESSLTEEDEYYLLFEAPPLIVEVSPITEPRSFDDVFPGFPPSMKARTMSSAGLRHSFEKDGSPMMLPAPDSGIDLLSSIIKKTPSHIIEALVVVPHGRKELDLLDIYNALGRIKKLKEHSIPINGRDFYIFMDTTRIESPRNRKPIPDPPPAKILPPGETMYLCFTDSYMGDLHIRGDISVSLYGITYSMSNFTDIRYSLFRIMRAERYSTVIYLEPVNEGILIYSVTGFYLPGFIANRISLTPNINVRISALISWITEGLRIQEDSAAGVIRP